MWISNKDEDFLNLSCIQKIAVRELEDGGYTVKAWSPDYYDYCLGTYDTEEQAKKRLAQIRQALRNAGHFISLD